MTEEAVEDDRRLFALSDAMRALAESATDYERLLATVTERLSTLIGDGALLSLLSKDETGLDPAAVWFRGPELQGAMRAFLTAGPTPTDGPALGARVFRTRTAVRIPVVDLEVLARSVAPNYSALIRELQIRSLLIVPLVLRGRALGLLSFARTGANTLPFSEADEAVALNLAEHAALAISNAQLLQSVQRELAQRRRAEEAAARFGALIEHSGEFIAMASVDGEILFINKYGRQMVGIGPEEDLSRLRLADFHTDEGLKRAPIIRATGRWQGRGQLRNLKTGELIDTQVSSFLVRDEAGAPVCFATVQHDVRETKKLEAQLRQAQKMEAIGTLAGGIAHDFNNILSAILSNLELARMDLDAAHPTHAHLEEIAKAGQRAVALVRQILTFGRQRESSKKIVRLADVVAEVMALLRSTISARVELVGTVAADTPNVSADPTQIHQILINLCTNAWQALKDRSGRIAVEVAGVPAEEAPAAGETPGRRWARVRVTDDGHGMDAATIERIFDPFFTTKAPGEGTGLGLSVVHGLVKDHLGTIRVESTPGVGTTFEILLPGVEEDAQAPVGKAAPRAAGGGRRLLYLDDEEVLVRSTEALLQRGGYEVRAFTQPNDLFEALRSDPLGYDAALTDYNMPQLSGLDVAKVIRAFRRDLPVILLSGYIPEGLRADAALAGIKEVLPKPCSLDDLQAAIERHAAPRRAP